MVKFLGVRAGSGRAGGGEGADEEVIMVGGNADSSMDG